MAQEHFDRLTALDASFLEQEGPTSHMHVGAVAMFENPVPDFDQFLDTIRGRLHLVPRYRVMGSDGRELAIGHDLDGLASQLADDLRDELRAGGHPIERTGLTDFDIDIIPTRIVLSSAADTFGFPALVDEGESVALRVLASKDEQAVAMWAGTRRLLLAGFSSQARAIRHLVDNELQNALVSADLGSAASWYHDCAAAAIDQLIEQSGGPVWDATAWV